MNAPDTPEEFRNICNTTPERYRHPQPLRVNFRCELLLGRCAAADAVRGEHGLAGTWAHGSRKLGDAALLKFRISALGSVSASSGMGLNVSKVFLNVSKVFLQSGGGCLARQNGEDISVFWLAGEWH